MASGPSSSRIGQAIGVETRSGVAPLPSVLSTDAVVQVALVAAFWLLYGLLGSTIASTRAFGRDDIYIHLFDADAYPFIKAVAGDQPSFLRTETHPLFPLFFRPVGLLLARVLGSDVAGAVLLASLAAATCVALAHAFLRRAGLAPLGALVWAVVLGLSVTQLMFGAIPDTFIFSAAVVIALFLLAGRHPGSLRHFAPAAILASGILVTNLVQSAIVFVLSLRPGSVPRQRALTVVRFVVLVLTALLGLGLLQSRLYPPRDHRFLYLGGEASWTFVPRSLEHGLLRAEQLTSHVFVYSLLSPKLGVVGPERPRHRWDMPRLSMQRRVLRLRPAGVLARGLWAGLILAAAVGLAKSRAYRRPDVLALATSLLFHLGLNYFYGREMFLYSPGWMFLLVSLVAIGVTAGYARGGWMARLCSVAVTGFAICEALNNGAALQDLVRVFERFRQATLGS